MNRLLAAPWLAMALMGCAAVPLASESDDAAIKRFETRSDRAQIYVFRNEGLGSAVRMEVSIDGASIGSTAAGTFLYRVVAPGRHTISSRAENTDTLEVDLAPGSRAFVWQEVKIAFVLPFMRPSAGTRTALHLVSEQEGRAGVMQTRLAAGR